MTSIDYESIFSGFLGNVTDFDFAKFDEDTIYSQMTEWLHKALSRTYIRRLFSSLSLNDDFQSLRFELEVPSDEDADSEFLTYVISKAMVCEWLEPQVKKTSVINQMFGGKEAKFFSQASHLLEIRTLLADTKTEVRNLIRDRGYIYNSYLGES